MKKAFPFLALLGSLGTLVCCVLPATFVALGLGSAFASLISTLPQLIWFSEQKAFVFGGGAILITIAAFFQWRSRYTTCPVDPRLAAACRSSRKWSSAIFTVTVMFYGVGFFFAFIAPLVL